MIGMITHTPSSICQNYGGDTDEAWERYISDLESLPQEFSVLGINDYSRVQIKPIQYIKINQLFR